MSEKIEAKDTIFCKKPSLNLRGELVTIDKPWVMGILNIGPDSFYDGGLYQQTHLALGQCEKMLSEGAQIIDIGAASSKPRATALTADEEWKRLENTVNSIRKEFPKAYLSVDTYHAAVAEKTAHIGADIINDISGGTLDLEMAKTMAKIKLPYILMHMQGNPQNMQQNPQYEHVFKEIAHFFSEQLALFTQAGVADVILDPGFGFGKTLKHNYELLAALDKFKIFKNPLLVGLSRKSMIGNLLDVPAKETLNGTTAAHVIALQNGAQILRVHDVKEAVEAVKIVTFTQNLG